MPENRIERPEKEDEPLGGLARRLVEDVNTLARDHVDLARVELGRSLRRAGGKALGMLIGAMVALIGLAMLCAALIPALEPLLDPLWARMLIAAGIYLVIGGAVAGTLLGRLGRDLPPEMPRSRFEARETAHLLKEQVHHG